MQIWESCSTEIYNRLYRTKNQGVETEEEVDTEEKYPHILYSEVEKAINPRRDKNSTGDDDVRAVGRRLFPVNP